MSALTQDEIDAINAPADPEAGPVGTAGPLGPVTGEGVLDGVRSWLARFISTIHDDDLDILALWAAHTHLVFETYTSPRLVLDSPVPGSGKTTVLEHLGRLCIRPIQAASISSPALLTRILENGMRTILIDEVDRSLDPKKEGVGDLIAILNSGYKRGGTRPVLIPTKEGWEVSEMTTFSPVAMAGNSPNLPDDTRSRSIRVLLMPDNEGRIEPSDWEDIEDDANALGERLAAWAERARDHVRAARPTLPTGCTGRIKERWAPLARVASAAGGDWPAVVERLIHRDLEEAEMDREDGLVNVPPSLQLLRDIRSVWEVDEAFVSTSALRYRLMEHHPEMWSAMSAMGKELTVQYLGRLLAKHFKINSSRANGRTPRGYLATSFSSSWRRMGIDPLGEPAQADQPTQPAQTEAF